MQIKYRLSLVFLICLALLIIACEKKEESTIVEPGLKVEDFESDKLNALPIIGYMQSGSVLPPVIDGNGVEEIWTLTEPYEVTTEGGPNGFGPTVTLKALYDNYHLFILATWDDTARSVQKDVWWMGSPEQGDTTYAERRPEYQFHRISEPFTGYIADFIRSVVDTTVVPPDTTNVYAYEKIDLSGNEDGFAIMWNINSTNFLGCTSLCHGSSMAADVNEAVDVWYWMAHKTNEKGYADDWSLQSTGFTGDEGDSLSFPNLKDGLPRYLDPMEPGRNLTFLNDSTVNTAFYASMPWEGGDRIPGHVLRWPSGSRANVRAVAVHSGDKWTLEMRRRLDTGVETDEDIQFNPDAQATVDFHIVVYDNADGASHAYSTGTHVLRFLQYNE